MKLTSERQGLFVCMGGEKLHYPQFKGVIGIYLLGVMQTVYFKLQLGIDLREMLENLQTNENFPQTHTNIV